MATKAELESLLKTQEAKLVKLKSGESKATQNEGDGRQEAAIHRCEAQIRQIKTELAASKPPVPGPTNPPQVGVSATGGTR